MNKKLQFKANFLSVEKNEEYGYFHVGFSDDEFEWNHYLLLNRSFLHDLQDKELDMIGEYMEVNDQVNGAYNICKNALLGEDFFKLILKENCEFSEIFIDISDLDLSEKVVDYLCYILENKIVFLGRWIANFKEGSIRFVKSVSRNMGGLGKGTKRIKYIAETTWKSKDSEDLIELEIMIKNNKFDFLQEYTGLWTRIEWNEIYNKRDE